MNLTLLLRFSIATTSSNLIRLVVESSRTYYRSKVLGIATQWLYTKAFDSQFVSYTVMDATSKHLIAYVV